MYSDSKKFYKSITWKDILITVAVTMVLAFLTSFMGFFVFAGIFILYTLINMVAFILFIVRMKRHHVKVYSPHLLLYLFIPNGPVMLLFRTF